ncbi:hypothetical protein LXT12_13625 [Pelomonas sp. P7]|uniref:Uncharacterized protein n=1 Tax=Pelomonas caseinilytica TaxID=2906763 RepID=A0ABS8XBG7_9BURK|nr:hypothetical protein [Pelomonas sp. P7]MCE4538292.1 hypothetical protein [Pelomonas sp. P7]
MDSTLVSGLTGFATAVVGTFLSHRFVQQRAFKEFAERYRNRLFDKQLAAYEALWVSLRRSSIYFSDETVFVRQRGEVFFSGQNATKMAIELTDVFFTEHGLYLSKSTRKALFDARRALQKASSQYEGGDPLVRIPREQFNEVSAALKELVQATRRDVGLRALRFNAAEIGIPEEQAEK